MTIQIQNLLHGMVKFDASDLHIKVGSPPCYRVHGSIQPVKNLSSLKPQDTLELAKQVLTEEQFAEFQTTGDLDCA